MPGRLAGNPLKIRHRRYADFWCLTTCLRKPIRSTRIVCPKGFGLTGPTANTRYEQFECVSMISPTTRGVKELYSCWLDNMGSPVSTESRGLVMNQCERRQHRP